MIVKNLLVVGVVAGFATAAAAQDAKGSWSVGGRVRVDNEQSSKEDTDSAGTKTTEKSSSIMLNRAQFSLTGSKDGHSIAITYYAEKSALYTAIISHKFSSMITGHFGRMKVLAQSVENSYDSIDQYLTSLTGESAHVPANSDGVRLDFAFEGDHALSLQAVEGVSQVGETKFENNGGLTTALQYRGNISGIKPIVTYTQVRTTARKSGEVDLSNGYMNQLGVGAQFNASGAAIDLEYDSVTMLKNKSDKTDKDSTMNSIVAQVKYAVGASTPFLKVSSDTTKLGMDKGAGDMSGMRLAVGVEHSLDESCRVHAFYMSKSSTTKKSEPTEKDAKSTTTGFNFGVTASM